VGIRHLPVEDEDIKLPLTPLMVEGNSASPLIKYHCCAVHGYFESKEVSPIICIPENLFLSILS
jgi:hypothetical protein